MFIRLAIIAIHLSLACFAKERIITIGGTATELVFALGAGEKVVAVDQSSVFPEEIKSLPQIGYIRAISAEGVLALKPTKIITTSEIGPKNALNQLKKASIPITILKSPNNMQEIYDAISEVGKSTGYLEEAESLINELIIDFDKIILPETVSRVLFIMKNPYVPASLNAAGKGTKATSIIELSGGKNVIDTHYGYKAISEESILELNPDVILIGFPESIEYDTDKIIDSFYNNDLYSDVNAVKNKQIYIVPLSKTLSFSNRTVSTIENLSSIFKKSLTQ